MIKFCATKAETLMIVKIVERAENLGLSTDRMPAVMDVEACHCNGSPLKLEEFLAADDFNFAHDFCGIQRNINRKTGQLENCFLPRFSV